MNNFHCSRFCTPKASGPAPLPAAEQEQREERTSNATVAIPASRLQQHLPAVLTSRNVKYRLPAATNLKSAFTDKTLNIPENVIKSRVTALLERMAEEKRLKSKDPVPVIVNKIFPSPGVMDENEFNKAVDPKDSSEVYKSIAESKTRVKDPDKPKLQAVIADTIKLAKQCEAESAGLKDVFGSMDAVAKKNYNGIATALGTLAKNMNTKITSDYNLDTDEVGLGGYALHDSQEVHLLLRIAQVKDEAKTKVTLIHEGAHLADPNVIDQGYYGSDGFEAKPEAIKIANAAHYEEIPRRKLGTSSFPGPFQPGVLKSGAKVTRADTVKNNAGEQMRMAWDAAVDVFLLLRDVRQHYLAGDRKPFKDNEAVLKDISKHEDLTIHEQTAGNEIVTTLDLTVAESIAHGYQAMMSEIEHISFPSKPGVLTDDQIRDQMVAQAEAKLNLLMRNPARDKTLTDWMVKNYKNIPSI
ncbi:MAG: hypothetical protein JO154_25460 [Chitinophaga sp.]|uniref:hypothetical protein n=1 Tax=Chitinophaga sp. TaxID=1869181 RepID=UPI0025BF453E|nr:hypothetical protein [Chitinophaga sp.]MBV8255968.1 hypothetical protein [Chitinophaga sp.]